MKKPKLYNYFVSFWHWNEGTIIAGNGCITLKSKEITTPEDVAEIIEYIKKENNFEKVIPINIIKLGRVK